MKLTLIINDEDWKYDNICKYSSCFIEHQQNLSETRYYSYEFCGDWKDHEKYVGNVFLGFYSGCNKDCKY